MGIHCWETHAHTAEISPCGVVGAAELAETYAQEGYAGVVVTNHLSRYGLQYVAERPWKEQMAWFYDGFEAVRAAAGELGLDASRRADPLCSSRGYLTLIRGTARENGFLLIQAHPFRNGMRITPPELLDGIETFNGNMRHDSRNFLAAQWAARYGLLATSGSDFHEMEDRARGGIFTGRDIRTMADFIAAVREGTVLKMSAERFGL